MVLAMDRSMRSIDGDGRLHVAVSHISKAGVNPYYGRDIPGAEKLGLQPDRIYQMLRDPDELAKAAATFNNLQILEKHVPVTADDPHRDKTVGSTGTDAKFNDPYLDNSLVFWDAAAIAGIESGQLKELSAAYHYDPDMTPGEFNGVKYDGIMRNLRGNHIAQVEEGRAGRDVVVMDAALGCSVKVTSEVSKVMTKRVAKPKVKPIRAMAHGILIGRKLAMDAGINTLVELLNGMEGPGSGTEGAPDRPEGGEVPTNNPADTGLGDPEGTNKAMLAEDDDIENKVRELLTGKLDDADLEMLLKLIRPEEEVPGEPEEGAGEGEGESASGEDTPAELEDEDGGKDEMPPGLKPVTSEPVPVGTKDKDKVDKPAMDAAIKAASAVAVKEAVKQTTERMRQLRAAEIAVRPWVGDIVVAMDSAADVYKFALEKSGAVEKYGLTLKGVDPSAYPTILSLVPKPGDAPRAERPRPAMDASVRTSILERYPDAKRIRVVG